MSCRRDTTGGEGRPQHNLYEAIIATKILPGFVLVALFRQIKLKYSSLKGVLTKDIKEKQKTGPTFPTGCGYLCAELDAFRST